MVSNRGQIGIYETLIIIVLVLCLIGLGYVYVHKTTDSQVYQNGSKPKVTDIEAHPGFGGCADLRVEQYMESNGN